MTKTFDHIRNAYYTGFKQTLQYPKKSDKLLQLFSPVIIPCENNHTTQSPVFHQPLRLESLITSIQKNEEKQPRDYLERAAVAITNNLTVNITPLQLTNTVVCF